MFRKFFQHRAGLGLGTVILWLARSALAAAPGNDVCAGALVIPGAGPFPYYTSTVDARYATSTNDPPLPTCRSVDVGRSVWFKFTPSSTRLYTISVSEDTATTVVDPVLAIYTSSGGCGGPFVQFACNDDQGDSKSAISITLNANVTYYIVVWMSAVSPPVSGLTSVQLRVSQPVAPVNDTCAGAEAITGSGPFPYLTSISDTTLATTTGDPPPPSCWPDHVRSVWFRFAPDTAASYEFSLCTNTATTVHETVLAIYTAPSGCGGTFTQIACNHTSSCGNKPRSTLTVALNTGVTYYIVAWDGVNAAYIPGETSMQIRVSGFLPPLATTLSATDLTSTSVVLNAAVNPNGLPATAWFEWGATTNYGFATALINIAASGGSAPMDALIGGLLSGQTYHFRVVATNNVGVAKGTDRSFAWSAARPNILSLTRTNSSYSVQFTGQAGQVYIIDFSSNLIEWLPLGAATDLENGRFTFADPNNNLRARFYRARSP